jgi:hypothetical protein
LDNDGFNEYELASIKNIHSIAKEKNSPLKFTINLCLYDFQEKDLEKLMDTINRNFVSSEHYLRLNNKPVIYIFWTGYLDGSKKHVELLEKNCNGFIKVANSLRLKEKDENEKTFGLFDGYCLYSPLELIAEKNWEKLWQQAYETNVKDDEVRVITVSPGYDDSHLKDDEREDNTYRVVERNNGKTYKRMIDFALSQKTPPHMAVLTSFNEYHENTHIEPSVDNGTLYMDMTKDFILKGKKKWDGR